MPSSTITNILPRMARLDGPYGVYGTVYGISTKVVHIAHPIPANLVLKSTKTKSPAYNHFKNFSGEGVFTADGEDWRQKRTSVIHCLLSKAAQSDRIEIEANRAAIAFIEKVESIHDCKLSVNSRKSKEMRSSTNIVPLLQSETVTIIYRYLTNEDPEKMQKQYDFAEKKKKKDILKEYLDAVTQIRMIILAQSRSFWFLLPRIFYSTLSPMYVEEEQAMGPIRKFASQACINAKDGSPLDILKQRKSHKGGNGVTSSSPLSKNILDEAITLLFAGQDTSAATLSWTLHLLSLHPKKQHKLATEIRQFLFTNEMSTSHSRTLNKKDILNEIFVTKKLTSQMPYLNAVLKESMRLYPVAPFVVRKLNEDIQLPNTNAILPKNSFACIWIYGLHHNPLMWKNPNQFFPERWINSEKGSDNNDQQPSDPSSTTAKIHNKTDRGITEGAYMPFASGPRNCLGQSLGIVILRIMLTKIIAKYEIVDECFQQKMDELKSCTTDENKIHELEEKLAISLRRDMQAGFTVLPSGGVEVSLRERKLI